MWLVDEKQPDRQSATRSILGALPSWFGLDEANERYIAAVNRHEHFFVARRPEGEIAGILSVDLGKHAGAELALLAVLPQYHRVGCGSALVRAAEELLAHIGRKYMFALTSPPFTTKRVDPYISTRAFYKARGFDDLTVLPDLWGKGRDALLFIKMLN